LKINKQRSSKFGTINSRASSLHNKEFQKESESNEISISSVSGSVTVRAIFWAQYYKSAHLGT